MKKLIPLAIRKALEEIASKSPDLYSVEFPPDSIVKFQDTDSKTDFHFAVIKMQKRNGKTAYLTTYVPCSTEHLDPTTLSLPVASIKQHFEKWLSLLEELNKPSPLFDDNFSQKYYEDLEPHFNIIDEDASTHPYSVDQQKRIVAFLDSAKSVLEQTDDNDLDTKETLELVEETKNNISKSTKHEVVIKIRKIIAKGFKLGLQIGEKLLIEFTTELSKKLLMGN